MESSNSNVCYIVNELLPEFLSTFDLHISFPCNKSTINKLPGFTSWSDSICLYDLSLKSDFTIHSIWNEFLEFKYKSVWKKKNIIVTQVFDKQCYVIDSSKYDENEEEDVKGMAEDDVISGLKKEIASKELHIQAKNMYIENHCIKLDGSNFHINNYIFDDPC